jgi:hypothetical protein
VITRCVRHPGRRRGDDGGPTGGRRTRCSSSSHGCLGTARRVSLAAATAAPNRRSARTGALRCADGIAGRQHHVWTSLACSLADTPPAGPGKIAGRVGHFSPDGRPRQHCCYCCYWHHDGFGFSGGEFGSGSPAPSGGLLPAAMLHSRRQGGPPRVAPPQFLEAPPRGMRRRRRHHRRHPAVARNHLHWGGDREGMVTSKGCVARGVVNTPTVPVTGDSAEFVTTGSGLSPPLPKRHALLDSLISLV